MTNDLIYTATTYLILLIYISLGVHVLTRGKLSTINWAFAGFAFSISLYYLSGLFLFPNDGGISESARTAIYIRWVSAVFIPIFYLHFTYYYFSSNFRSKVQIFIPLFYGLTLVLLVTIPFTDLFLRSLVYNGPDNQISEEPGPLLWFFIGMFLVISAISFLGLVSGYRRSPSAVYRRQITLILIPWGLMLISASSLILFLASGSIPIPFFIFDLVLAIAGILYASVVMQYGTFTGKPTAIQEAAITVIGTIFAITILIATLRIDLYLSQYLAFPIPIISSILLTIYVAGFFYFSHTVYHFLQRLFNSTEQNDTGNLRINNILDANLLRSELLTALTEDIGADGIFIAEKKFDEPISSLGDHNGVMIPITGSEEIQNSLRTTVVHGNIPLSIGQHVHEPNYLPSTPALANSLGPDEYEKYNLYGLVAFRRLSAPETPDAMLAVCKIKTSSPVTNRELQIIEAYARQLELAQQIIYMDQQKKQLLIEVSQQENTIIQLQENISSLLKDGFVQETVSEDIAPLRIHLLGDLQVFVDGLRVSDTAWESERARELLAYLLWKGPGGVSTTELIDNLWPEKANDQNLNALYVTINRLRRVLEPNLTKTRDSTYILSMGGRYKFNFQSPYWLDVEKFLSLAGSSRVDDLRQAVEIYRGNFLEDTALALPADIEAYRYMLLQEYLNCIRILLTQVNQSDKEYLLKRLIAEEPLDQDANLQIGELYLERGRADLAFDHLANYRKSLAAAGIEFPQELRTLWRRVERQLQQKYGKY